mgnify:CR=1 FL=1
MAERATAAERLERILLLVPLASRPGGATYAELAAALGVSVGEVVDDITALCARAYDHPAGLGDALQVNLEGERVEVWTTGDFRRPARLTPREALALGLAVRSLAVEAQGARREEILALARRLEAALAAQTVEPPPLVAVDAAVGDCDEDPIGVVMEGARTGRVLRVDYLKPGVAEPETRRIAPYRLVHAEGQWYVLAHCAERGAVRIFRLDRILAAALTSECFTVPADFDAAAFLRQGRPFAEPEPADEAEVVYSPRIARWIAEHGPCEARADGSVVVRHRVADPQWIVRHVLHYAGDAEVVRPAELRALVRDVARRIAAGGDVA